MVSLTKIIRLETSSTFESTQCDLMGTTGIIVQFFLGMTCLLALLGNIQSNYKNISNFKYFSYKKKSKKMERKP